MVDKETKKEVVVPIEKVEENKDSSGQVLNEMFALPEVVTVGIMEVKVQPAPFGDLPRITKMLLEIDQSKVSEGLTDFSDGAIIAIAEFIHDAVKMYHPNYTVDFIKDHFPLLVLPDFIEARIQGNRFLAKMGKTTQGLPL